MYINTGAGRDAEVDGNTAYAKNTMMHAVVGTKYCIS